MNLNHVHIGAGDVGICRSFYEKYFGFRKKSDHGQGVFLVNDHNFLLVIDPVSDPIEFPSWYHLGFCLNSATEVLSIYKKLCSDAVPLARDLRQEAGQFASFFVKDPAGNKLEVSWHAE